MDILRNNGGELQVAWPAALIPAAGEKYKDSKNEFCTSKTQLSELGSSVGLSLFVRSA